MSACSHSFSGQMRTSGTFYGDLPRPDEDLNCETVSNAMEGTSGLSAWARRMTALAGQAGRGPVADILLSGMFNCSFEWMYLILAVGERCSGR